MALSSFAFTGPTVGWGVSEGPGLLRTGDGGRNWGQCSGRIVGVPASGSGALPASVNELEFPAQVRTVAGEVLLSYYARSPLLGAPAPQPTTSGILASQDGGATWRRILSLAPSRDSVLSMVAVDARHVWALCGSGNPDQPDRTYLLRTSDGGVLWARLPGAQLGVAGPTGIEPFTMTDTAHGWSWFVPYSNAAKEAIRTTSDGGLRWRAADPRTPKLWLGDGHFALDRRRAWIAGSQLSETTGPSGGALYATSDGGRRWQRSQGIDAAAYGPVFFADPRHGWVVFARGQQGGGIMATGDGGATWREVLSASGPWWLSPSWSFDLAGGTLFLASAEGGGLWSCTVTSAVH